MKSKIKSNVSYIMEEIKENSQKEIKKSDKIDSPLVNNDNDKKEKVVKEVPKKDKVEKEVPKKDKVDPVEVDKEISKKDKVDPVEVDKETPKKDKVDPVEVDKETPKKDKVDPVEVDKETSKKDKVVKEVPKKDKVDPVEVDKETSKKDKVVKEVPKKDKVDPVEVDKETSKKDKVVKEVPKKEKVEKETPKKEKVAKEDAKQEKVPKEDAKKENDAEKSIKKGKVKADEKEEKELETDIEKVNLTEDLAKERPVLPTDFDWSELDTKGFGDSYSEKEIATETSFYENTLTIVDENVVVEGKVVTISGRDVIIDIGFKSDGTVSLSEFRDIPDLKVGDTVQVYVEEHENQAGELVLSRKKAKVVNAWDTIKKSYENDDIIRGFVKRRTKGGLIVDIFGIESFLPGSQVDVKPIRDFDIYVNKEMEVKVVKINYSNDNVVVSHKVLIEKDLEAQKVKIINNLEKGQILRGTVKNTTSFGVFVDLGGVDGLLHITDISWRRISDPTEILELDQKIKVVVLDFDENKKRISLGMKQLEKHPWDDLDEDLKVGSKVEGAIVNVADYGAFLEIKKGVEGLIHVSEMSWSQHLRNPQEFIKVGEKLEAVVLTLDKEAYKMSLGVKQLTEDPWTKKELIGKYAAGTKHKGIVRNLTTFGLFLELEEGIDGLVHISDLSWTKKIRHPHEFIKVGEELEVQVLDLDKEKRKLALGHKQLEENPWDTFEDVFVVGTTHKCVVDTKSDKGAILELPYGLHGFAPGRTLKKENGVTVEVGESLDFVVIDFNKDDRKIYLSHQATYSKEKKSPNKKQEIGRLKRKINKDRDSSTLGDIQSLVDLKEKMTKSENDKLKKKSKTDKKK